MHAQVGTDSQCVSPDIYESLLHGNREMHRQHHPKTPEIVNRFGNHERALRTAEGELVGITPAAAAFLAERLFTGGSVPRNRLLVPDGTPLHDVAALGVLRALFVEAVSHGETACGNKHHRGAILFVDNDRRKHTSGRTECKCSQFGKDFVICWRIHSAL